MALDVKASPSTDTPFTSQPRKVRPLVELSIGYGLILATIWTPRPYQQWLWWVASSWVVLSTIVSFPGWAAMGFRRG